MGKKEKVYTSLSAVDHRLQFINVVAVINGITPTIKRDKLCSVDLDISDTTMHNPGFVVKLKLEKETLNQFLNNGKEGLIIQLLEMKVVKNDGNVYGEIWDEEELKLYSDNGTSIKWYPEEKISAVSDGVKSSINILLQWKQSRIKVDSKINSASNCNKDTRATRMSDPKADFAKIEVKTPKGNNAVKDKTNSTETQSKRKVNDPVKNAELSKLEDTQEVFKKSGFELNKSSSPKVLGSKAKLQLETLEDEEVSFKNMSIINRRTRSNSPLKKSDINRSSLNSAQDIIKNVPKTIPQSPSTTIKHRRSDNISSPDNDKKKRKLQEKISDITDNINSLDNDEKKIKLQEKITDNSPSKTKEVSPKYSVSASKTLKESPVNHGSYDNKIRENSEMKQTSPKVTTKQIELNRSKTKIFENSRHKENSKSPFEERNSAQTNSSSPSKSELRTDDEHLKNVNCKLKIKKSSDMSATRESRQLKTDTSFVETKSPRKSQIGYTNKKNSDSECFISPKNIPLPEQSNVNVQKLQRRLKVKQNPVLNSSDSSISSDSTSEEKASNSSKLQDKKKNEVETNAKSVHTTKKTQFLLSSEKTNNSTIDKNQKSSVGKLEEKQFQSKRKDTLITTKNFDADEISNNVASSKKENLSETPRTQDLKRKQTRSSGKTSVPKAQSIKTLSANSSIFQYLKPLTNKILFTQAEMIGDVSLCDLEEIIVSEKFNLQCQVISQFTLFEDDIQVVRVLDGSICSKKGVLIIPKKSSWRDVTQAINEVPVVKKNSPFIDIIIFNFTRSDIPFVSNKCYLMHNIMAIKMDLKDDPRKEKPKGELFFCAEGQNIYNKRLQPKSQKEILKRMNEKKFINAWEEITKDKNLEMETYVLSLNNTSSSQPDVRSPEKQNHEKSLSPILKKRKLNDSQSRNVGSSEIPKKTMEIDHLNNEQKNRKEKSSADQNTRQKTNNDILVEHKTKNNLTTSSDETLLDDTPPLYRELNEIMHEESILGLPLSLTEDIHLKNSGSEVTFSEFCEGANAKVKNFRTSTQAENLSDSIEVLNDFETVPSEDGGKMEPLVYCPSGSSLSSAVEVSSSQKRQLKGNIQLEEDLSESLLQSYVIMDKSYNKQQKSDLEEKQTESQISKDNASDKSQSSSIKVLSSNSSDLEYKVVEGSSSLNKSNTRNVRTLRNKVNISNAKSPSFPYLNESHKEHPNKGASMQAQSEISPRNKSDSEESSVEQIEIISDNSSNASFFSVENNHLTVNPGRSDAPIFKSSNQYKFNQIELSSENNRMALNDLEEKIQRIPDKCFFKSNRKQPTLTEAELSAIYNDGSAPLKYFSYSYDRHLPHLSINLIRKLISTNYLTITVTIASITPSFSDPWQESFVKSRCPNCSKLYNVYNALNNTHSENTVSTAALTVGSHIVCPESQCCNQILDNPEFDFSMELKLKDDTLLTALIAAKHAEDIFGCSAQGAATDENQLRKVSEVLQKISNKIGDGQPIRVSVTREVIYNQKSGPLYIKQFYF